MSCVGQVHRAHFSQNTEPVPVFSRHDRVESRSPSLRMHMPVPQTREERYPVLTSCVHYVRRVYVLIQQLSTVTVGFEFSK